MERKRERKKYVQLYVWGPSQSFRRGKNDVEKSGRGEKNGRHTRAHAHTRCTTHKRRSRWACAFAPVERQWWGVGGAVGARPSVRWGRLAVRAPTVAADAAAAAALDEPAIIVVYRPVRAHARHTHCVVVFAQSVLAAAYVRVGTTPPLLLFLLRLDRVLVFCFVLVYATAFVYCPTRLIACSGERRVNKSRVTVFRGFINETFARQKNSKCHAAVS